MDIRCVSLKNEWVIINERSLKGILIRINDLLGGGGMLFTGVFDGSLFGFAGIGLDE